MVWKRKLTVSLQYVVVSTKRSLHLLHLIIGNIIVPCQRTLSIGALDQSLVKIGENQCVVVMARLMHAVESLRSRGTLPVSINIGLCHFMLCSNDTNSIDR